MAVGGPSRGWCSAGCGTCIIEQRGSQCHLFTFVYTTGNCSEGMDLRCRWVGWRVDMRVGVDMWVGMWVGGGRYVVGCGEVGGCRDVGRWVGGCMGRGVERWVFV